MSKDKAPQDIEDNGQEQEQPNDDVSQENGELQKTIHIKDMYENWFLDYASYVILERAVPDIDDGLKPVQRRILHAMKEMDDGRFNKVANIIGQTMQYHPHGDASIGDALIQLGQKDLLIDMQGNWGNVLTGDSAAAPRYIEARLSKFAIEVSFNPKTTIWQQSYDGRKREPVALPLKFPLLLAQGVEGIAVGLASKILPHNFNELIDASIDYLKGKETEIYPDFPTGGYIDVSKYNDGLRGGKIRVRAKINQLDKKTLVITEIPFGTTTSNLIDSVITANDKGKIKIRKIEDNTAAQVEILVHLTPGVSPDVMIDALYAFTDCEMSISVNSCVIDNNKPRFAGVKDMLALSTRRTVELLKKELEIRKAELEEDWHFASLEKIFIQKRIYLDIEKCETWESVIETIDKGLKPYKKKFRRPVTTADIERLTEIKIKRISKYDSKRADDLIQEIETNIEEVINHLAHLIDYAINYFKQIKKKYGKDKDRKTEIRNFDTIQAAMVAVANQRLYVNRAEGFVGTSLRKDEFVCECSDIDDIVVIREDGICIVTKVGEKNFVGQNIIHINVFKKNDDRTIYNMIYRDGPNGSTMIKRFAIGGVTRDKEYDLTKGTKGSKVLYFTANPNGEAEVVTVKLRPRPKLKKLSFDFDFSAIAIKGRGSIGNILSKNPVSKIVLRDEGVSTLSARDIWYDETVRRLNADGRGIHLGAFVGDDKILTVMQSGFYRLSNYDLSNHFEEDMVFIKKFSPSLIISAAYIDGNSGQYYIKRFHPESSSDKKTCFITEHPKSTLEFVSIDHLPMIELNFKEKSGKKKEPEEINIASFITVKGEKAKGNKLSDYAILKIKPLESLPYDEPEVEFEIETEPVRPVTEKKEPIEPVLIPEDSFEEDVRTDSEIQKKSKPKEAKNSPPEINKDKIKNIPQKKEEVKKGKNKADGKDKNLQIPFDFN